MKVFYDNVPVENLFDSEVDSKTFTYLKCLQNAVRHIEYDDEGNGINVIHEGSGKTRTVFMHPMSDKIKTLVLLAMKEHNC